jgi:pimeloyl-ACP methyl ester carboxylesterase
VTSPLRRVAVGDVQLAYRTAGELEGRGVLLVHGSWDDHRTWDGVVAGLREHCRVVAYDRRGHSASTAPPGQGRIGEDVDDAAGLVEALGLGPATVVGHSYGAAVALLLAMRRPDVVRRLVVPEPPLYVLLAGDPVWEPVRAAAAVTMAAVAGALEAGELEAGARRFVDEVAFGAGAFDGLFDECARATILANADTWLDQSRDPERLTVDVRPLAGSTIPLTVTTGTASLPAFPEIARRVVALVPHAELVRIQGAGHGAPVSHAAQLAQIVRNRLS